MRIRDVIVEARPSGTLAPLVTLTHDLDPRSQRDAAAIIATLDPETWMASEANAPLALARLHAGALEAGAQNADLIAQLAAANERLEGRRAAAQWTPEGASDMRVAYFSCEFGLDASLPVYSGGLGLLSGDHLKAAADLHLPLVAIGLFYRNGYFRQDISADGRQVERYPASDERELPISLATTPDGAPIRVTVDLAGERVACQVWKAQVGSISLYLLDTDLPENAASGRQVTDLLYGGDREHRIRQELVLGIGGVRALGALGITPTVFHMNEGHSAFLAIERLRELMTASGLSAAEALEVVRASSVFTTHTPVPAGNEVFEAELASRYVSPLLSEIGLTWDAFAALSRPPGQSDGPIGMTVLALRSASRANGVSALHGVVSRDMWQSLWPGRLTAEVPIGHVTNGVHTGTWLSPSTRGLLAEHGLDRIEQDAADPAAWEGVNHVADQQLWRARCEARAVLIARVARNGIGQPGLDPNALTIGFSRRFATYKRAALLLRQPERLRTLLSNADRPVQIVIAGKAHPHDDPGKGVMQSIIQAARALGLERRIAFVPDYDISIAKDLVGGADVWLNTPRRPYEASGTSGMKAALNGVLNLSVLDGWWPEGYAADLGWAIGDENQVDDAELQDARDVESLFSLLETQVVPTFYDRDEHGRPAAWLAMMRRSMLVLGPQFSTQRMVRDYAQTLYAPAHIDGQRVSADGFRIAKEAAAWRARATSAWPGVRIAEVTIADANPVGQAIPIQIAIESGGLTPAEVEVQALILHRNAEAAPHVELATPDAEGRYHASLPSVQGGRLRVAVRVVAGRSDVGIDVALATWDNLE